VPAQVRVYRSRIKSAQTTKKITRAMELISASRIAKAQQRVAASLPYARAVTRAVSAVATYSNVDHILTREAENPKRAAIVIFSSDRGLAGAFNSNVLRKSEELAELLRSEGKEVVSYLVGRKAVGYYRFRRREFVREWVGGTDNPTAETAHEIADAVVEAFVQDTAAGGVDEIHVVYNRFVSMLTQTPEMLRLLPLEVVEGVEEPADRNTLPLHRVAALRRDARERGQQARGDAAGDEGGERQRGQADPRVHQAREQREAAGDHAADLRDRRRRRRPLHELAQPGS
jgi:F-type H+-transporting ATPase subunit gamma